jgi:DNA-binding NarL/FixJ family response regulator
VTRAAVIRADSGCLIVDDNAAFLDAARNLLEREGMPVAGVASTAAEAVRQVAALRPEVVLVDVMLGEESGFDVALRLVAGDQPGGSTIILISTHAESDFADLIDESPATGFLPKADLSADAIRRIVEGSDGERRPGASEPRGTR